MVALFECAPFTIVSGQVPFSSVTVPGEPCPVESPCFFGTWDPQTRSCVCLNGYGGSNCETIRCPGGCPDPTLCNYTCNNHGVCLETNQCQCASDWQGPECAERASSDSRALAIGLGVGLGVLVLISVVGVLVYYWYHKAPPTGQPVLLDDKNRGPPDMDDLDIQ